MAIFMQVISARLGVVTGKDLAQCCRDWYPALDPLAQLAASANWPSAPATWPKCSAAPSPSTCCSTFRCSGRSSSPGCDVLLLLALQRFGMRTIEAVVLVLVATIGVCYFIEIFVLPQTQPGLSGNGPRAAHARASATPGMMYVAIGIIGATVMPHNLYLHSALVQSRKLQKDEALHPQRHPLQHHRFRPSR